MVGLAVFEDIANSAQSADEGLLAVAVDLAAQPVDVDVYDVGVGLNAHAPDILEDHGAGDDAAGVAAKVLEEDELLGSELEELAGARSFAAEEVELKIKNMEAGCLPRGGRVAAEKIAQAGEEFSKREGLGEVVIAALFQAADAIVDGAASREDEDGSAHADLAKTKDEVNAVHVRKAEIDDEDVIGIAGGEAFGGAGVRRNIHAVACLRKGLAEKGLDVALILNQ
jgi:hypothetical protein